LKAGGRPDILFWNVGITPTKLKAVGRPDTLLRMSESPRQPDIQLHHSLLGVHHSIFTELASVGYCADECRTSNSERGSWYSPGQSLVSAKSPTGCSPKSVLSRFFAFSQLTKLTANPVRVAFRQSN